MIRFNRQNVRYCSFSVFLPLLLVSSLLAAPREPEIALSNFKKSVKSFTLANGMRVLLRYRPQAPVFSGVIAVRVGGVDEITGQTGISHLLEHMAFKGTKKIGTRDYQQEQSLLSEQEKLRGELDQRGYLPRAKLDKLMEIDLKLQKLWNVAELDWEYKKRGATGLNASTGKELTRYYVSLPKASFEFWCRMETDRILNPVYRQFYRERDVVLEERRMRFEDDPRGRLYELLLEKAFQLHPYRQPVIGYKSDLQRLSPSLLYDLHRKYYVPANMVVAIVGDLDPDRALPLMKKYFGKIPKAPLPKTKNVIEPQQSGERRVTSSAVATEHIFLAYRKPVYPHPDSAALALLPKVLAGSRISPLYRRLVKEEQLSTGLFAFTAPGQAFPNLLVFSAELKGSPAEQDFLTVFDQVINEFKKTGPTRGQLEMAKRKLLRSYLDDLETNIAQARTISMAEILYGRWSVIFDWYEKALEVTREDLRRVAKTYLVSKSRTVAVSKKKK